MKYEEMILSSQGGYANAGRLGWRLGHFYLTDQRLLFSQPLGIIFETPFRAILDLKIERRGYVLIEMSGGRLTVSHPTLDGDKRGYEEILFPTEINPSKFTWRYRNNILEIRFEKAKWGKIERGTC